MSLFSTESPVLDAPVAPPIEACTREHEASSFAREYRRYDRMLAPLGRRLFEAAELRRGMRVLDVGTGAGSLALSAGVRVGPDGRVVGIDIDADCLAVARRRAAERHVTHVTFAQGDAATQGFAEGRLDAIVSRFGTLHFEDPRAGYDNLRRALRPDGKLTFVAAREARRNPWATVPLAAIRRVLPDLPAPDLRKGPFVLADPEAIRTLLRTAGYRDVRLESVDEPLCIGADVEDALEFFHETDGRRLDPLLDAAALHRVNDALATALEGYDTGGGVFMPASVWVVTARP